MDHTAKVLMIDDEQDLVQFFFQTFRNFKKIQFFTALRAREGVEIARKEKPNVIMLDLRMPGMKGEEALLELKELLPEAKFIIMTGWEDGETRERIENEIGVDAYYPKPVDLEDVVAKVMQLLTVNS